MSKLETRAVTKLPNGLLKYQVEQLEDGENYLFEASLTCHNFSDPLPATIQASVVYTCFISRKGDITLTFDINKDVPISRHLPLFNLLVSFIKRANSQILED